MTFKKTHFAAAAALMAATSLGSAPATAADIEIPRASTAPVYDTGWTSADEVYEDRRYRRHRHRGGVSVGDVLVGALIIGVIASAVDSSNDRDDRYRNRDRNNRDTRYDRRNTDTRGIDRAAQMCVREIERDARVDSVESVNRTSQGWNVAGRLYNGDGFSCDIGNDGRIQSVDVGAGRVETSAAPAQDNQWDDDVYARARMQAGDAPASEAPVRNASADTPEGPQPAYPGGPIPGEEGYADTEMGG
ncbi:hypothetical protein [Altererythrobacter sp. ZODW24]|uniref:hypothetical protein n=1 Tax=Altererythrobacter sp. ZODW24 TaxID=2185142 RepID=UPI001965AF44|nr:hypothetical protein [Altererythrobacter sp. ZODW24]